MGPTQLTNIPIHLLHNPLGSSVRMAHSSRLYSTNSNPLRLSSLPHDGDAVEPSNTKRRSRRLRRTSRSDQSPSTAAVEQAKSWDLTIGKTIHKRQGKRVSFRDIEAAFFEGITDVVTKPVDPVRCKHLIRHEIHRIYRDIEHLSPTTDVSEEELYGKRIEPAKFSRYIGRAARRLYKAMNAPARERNVLEEPSRHSVAPPQETAADGNTDVSTEPASSGAPKPHPPARLAKSHASTSRGTHVEDADAAPRKDGGRVRYFYWDAAPPAAHAADAPADAAPAPQAAAAPALTHLSATGAAHMVSVAAKPATRRAAVAAGRLLFSAAAPLALLPAAAGRKGDVLAVARVAGIMAAKRTGELVPLCHSVGLDTVAVEMRVVGPAPEGGGGGGGGARPFGAVEVEARVECVGPTGVEMEALSAVMGAALTLYDMCKAVDKGMVIEGVRVVLKEGGRSGTFVEEGWRSFVEGR